MKFKKWLKKFEDVDNPVGDFAKDVARDEGFPTKSDYQVIYNHLQRKNAIKEVFETFDVVWDLYERLGKGV